jgi:hypothetical protein
MMRSANERAAFLGMFGQDVVMAHHSLVMRKRARHTVTESSAQQCTTTYTYEFCLIPHLFMHHPVSFELPQYILKLLIVSWPAYILLRHAVVKGFVVPFQGD